MSARKRALNVSAFTLDGTNYLGAFEVLEFPIESVLEEGRGGAEAYDVNYEVKRRSKHRFTILQDGSSSRSTNLSVSAYTVGGTDLLADLKGGSVTVTNRVQDGSGLATRDEFPNAVGASMTISTKHLVPYADTEIAMLTDALSGDPDDRQVTIVLTLDTVAISAPMRLQSLTVAARKEEFLTYDAEFVSAGTPTSPTGSTLYGAAITGDGLISVSADIGVGTLAGTGVISELSFQFDDAKIIRNSGTIDIQGALDYTPDE